MKIHVHVASGKDREEGLALSLKGGLKAFGDTVEASPVGDFQAPDPESDIGAVFGLKGRSREILDAYRSAGKHTILFDKALIRVPGSARKHIRICLDGFSPLPHLMRIKRRSSRWEKLNVNFSPRREPGTDIILALSSQKYCDFFGLGEATAYATSLVKGIRSIVGDQRIIYRPKPSWHDFVPIPGTALSRPPEILDEIIPNARVLITHGSSAAIDAVISGVSAIALGDCAASPVSSDSLKALRSPFFPDERLRWLWLCSLAWFQWTSEELVSGEAWEFIRGELAA